MGHLLSTDFISTLHVPSNQGVSYAERIRLREEKATQAKTHEKTKGEISYGRTKKGTKKKGCPQTSTDVETEITSFTEGGARDP